MAKKTSKKTEIKQAKATTTKTHSDGSEEHEEEAVGEPMAFDEPPCNVGITAGMTIPTVPFGNVKFSVSLFVPCAHEEIDEAYEFTKDWVDERVGEIEESIQGE